jgi:tetratricopeptide (TPR) repeat protein
VLRLNPRAAAAQVQLSELHLVSGARQPALQLAQDAARTLPRDPLVAVNLIRMLTANGDTRSAETLARRLVAAYPKAAAAHAAAGAVALARKDRQSARRSFERAQELDPGSFDALAGLVALDLGEKKPDTARARVDQRLASAPADGPVLLLAARIHAATGDRARAEQLLRDAISTDASNIRAYGMLAGLYAAERRLPEARANLEAIVARRPEEVGVHTLIAMTYETEGNRDEARKRYERIMQIDPSAAVAANNLAFIYAEEGGNLDVALQLAQTAKARLPDVAEVNDTLGLVYYKKDLASLAVPLFEQAAQKDPENAAYKYRLGLAAIKAGDIRKGKEALEQVIKLNPDGPLAPDARKALQES